MNALLAFIPKPLMAGAIVVLVIIAWFQARTINKQAGEVAKAIVAVEQAKETNETNVANIEELETQLNDVRAQWETDVALMDEVKNQWAVERERLKALSNEKETERVEVFRDPTCSELAKINITAICPAFVDGMRQRADSLNGN